MERSPLIDALRGDLAALHAMGVIDATVLLAFDAVQRQGIPPSGSRAAPRASCRIAAIRL